MNFRLTAILFSSILVIGVGLLIYSFFGGDATPADVLLEELVAAKPEEITAVELEKEDGSKLRLVREGKDRWDAEWDAASPDGKDKKPVKAKADAATVNQLVAALLKAKPVDHPERRDNPAVHGLQPPGLKVTLRQGDKSGAINFGDVLRGGADAVVFVTTSSRPGRPMATPRGPIEALFRAPGGSGKTVDLAKWASDFRVKSVFAVDARGGDDVASFSLSAKGKTLALEKAGPLWKFTTPAGWGEADPVGDVTSAPGAFTGVRPLLSALTGLQALAPADFIENPTAQQLTDFGLNPGNPDAVRVEIKNTSGETTVAYIGKKDTTPPPPGMPGVAPPSKVWVRVEGQPGVIRANVGDLSGLVALIQNPDPLRDRTLLAVDRSRIDGIDISGGVKLRRTGPEWKLFGPPTPNDPQSTSLQAVTRLLDALTAPRTVRSFPAVNDANFTPGVTQAEVKIWADGFEPQPDPKAEPKPRDKAQPTTLVFGRREGDSIFVRRIRPDGAKADFLVPDKIKVGTAPDPVDLMSSVAKSRLDLLDPTLKTFAPEAATRMTVTGVMNYEVTKDEKKDPSTNADRWTFAAPTDKKGQTADTGTIAEMLRILGTTQSVSRFVNEFPSPEQLVEYGLALPAKPPADAPPAPRLKLVIGLKDGADKERVFEFGKETSDPNYVYARQPGRPAVFTLPRLVFDRFAKADLRDRAIFEFDPAAVTSVQFKGWGNSGFVTELFVEKNKDGVWTVKSPPSPANFALDPNKVTAFLNTLRKTTVKSFEPGTPEPKHGFGDPKESLYVQVEFGGKRPGIALYLGKLTADGQAYQGWTSIIPQTAPLFTVDAAPFKPYRESPGAFAK